MLPALWRLRGEAQQVDAISEAKRVVQQALDPGRIPVGDELLEADKNIAHEAVQAAIAHLSETRAALPRMALINMALQYGLGKKLGPGAILQAMAELQAQGELLALPRAPAGPVNFTTRQLIVYEKEVLQSLRLKQTAPLSPATKITEFLSSQPHLTAQQRKAVTILFSSQHKILALEGPAGTGKTFLIQPMMELARLSGHRPILLAPSRADSDGLKREFQTPPESLRAWARQLANPGHYGTVAGFLKQQEGKPLLPRKQVIFVDRAMSLGVKQMHSLVKLAERSEGTRLVLVGDSKALLPCQAGAPFWQMLQQGMVTAALSKNLSAQPNGLKSALASAGQNNLVAALAKIGQRIVTAEGATQCLAALAARYAAIAPAERQNTRILMPSQQKRHEANLAVRAELKQRGQLQLASARVQVLLPKALKESEYGHAKSYGVGQWVRFNEACVPLRIAKGEYCRIKAARPEEGMVWLENAKGKTIAWGPAKVAGKFGAVEVFIAQKREIAVGEALAWQRNDLQRNLLKGERLIVAQIDGRSLQLARLNGKRIWLNLQQAQARHFDYGYAITPYQNAAGKAATVLAYQNSASRQCHPRWFYQALAQATREAWLYTENKTQLLKQLQKHTGDKATAAQALLGKRAVANPAGPEHSALLEKAVSAAIAACQQSGKRQAKQQTPRQLARVAVNYALRHLSEREAAFSHQDVVQAALQHALGTATPAFVQTAIVAAEAKGNLLRGVCSIDGERWTTRSALMLERKIMQLAQEGQGALPPFAPPALLEKHLAETSPKPEHARAVRMIAHCQDRIALVQGHAGTGKTTMLKNVEGLFKSVGALLGQQGHGLLCLAPTHVAVKELTARGLQAQTVDSYIAEFKRTVAQRLPLPRYRYQRALAIDESSMLSNQRAYQLLRITRLQQVRLLIVGDEKQYPAIESGKPYSALLRSGLQAVALSDIQRQKDGNLQRAVKQIYQGQFAAALKTLGDRVIEIGQAQGDDAAPTSNAERLQAISADYLSRPAHQRAKTLIITLGNEDREKINALVREGLQKQGALQGKGLKASVLVPRGLSQAELAHSENYRVGDIVRFSAADSACGIAKNQYLTVAAVYSQENLLVLQKDDGGQIIWHSASSAKAQWGKPEVYEQKPREIQAGDWVRWTRTDKAQGFASSELAKVERVGKGKCALREMIVTTEGMALSEKVFEIRLKKPSGQHWDHAYAMTGYSAQGKSVAQVILHLESFHRYLTSRPSAVVTLSRAIEGLTVYTDDKEALAKAIWRNKGEKASALETLGEPPWPQQKARPTSQAKHLAGGQTPAGGAKLARQTSEQVGGANAPVGLNQPSGSAPSPVRPEEALRTQGVAQFVNDKSCQEKLAINIGEKIFPLNKFLADNAPCLETLTKKIGESAIAQLSQENAKFLPEIKQCEGQNIFVGKNKGDELEL